MSPAERGIVTLCDANYYPGLLMLHRSVQESCPCPIVCYDVGLTPGQRSDAAGRENLRILPLPDDPLIDRVKAAMGGSPPLAKLHKRVWPLWICPILIRHAPLRDLFWMDCDLVVLRGLPEMFALVGTQPVFTPENKAPHLTANRPELYQLLPIRRTFDPRLPTINAGVSGWRKGRDDAAIEAYVRPVEMASDDRRVRDAIAWHDQGALIWAIQACALEGCVVDTTGWNLCVDHTSLVEQPLPWGDRFLERARAAVPDAKVLHWNGREPPWARGG